MLLPSSLDIRARFVSGLSGVVTAPDSRFSSMLLLSWWRKEGEWKRGPSSRTDCLRCRVAFFFLFSQTNPSKQFWATAFCARSKHVFFLCPCALPFFVVLISSSSTHPSLPNPPSNHAMTESIESSPKAVDPVCVPPQHSCSDSL